MVFCEHCGKNIAPGIKLCENCGAPVNDQLLSPPSPPQNRSETRETPAAYPKPMPIPHIYIAAGGFMVVVIIIAFVLASGGVSGIPNHMVIPMVKQVTTTSTPTPKTTVAPVKDPIIGAWRFLEYGGKYGSSESDTYQFKADGTFVRNTNSFGEKLANSGTWSVQGGNSYRGLYSGGISFYIYYDPAKNAIYEPTFPNVLYTPVP